jgi:hypothetical protein
MGSRRADANKKRRQLRVIGVITPLADIKSWPYALQACWPMWVSSIQSVTPAQQPVEKGGWRRATGKFTEDYAPSRGACPFFQQAVDGVKNIGAVLNRFGDMGFDDCYNQSTRAALRREKRCMCQSITTVILAAVLAAILATGGLGQDEADQTPPEMPARQAKKLPVPAAAAQQRALDQIKDVFADEYQTATTPTQKNALALALFNQAAKTEKDAAAKFVLLRQSQDLALAAADLAAAFKALDQIANHFQIDLLTEKADLFKKAARLTNASAATELVKTILPHIDEALAADRFELARELVRVAISLARSKRDPALNRDLSLRTSKINEHQKQWDEAQKAAARLKESPTDAASNHKLGHYRVFAKGDWETGLPLLAKGPFSPLRKAAQLDLAQPTEPALRAQLADAWWKLADAAPPAEKPRLIHRAKLWYQRALPKLVDLEKVRVEKRLEKIDDALKAAAEPKTKPSKDILDIALAPGHVQRFRLIPRGQLTLQNGKSIAAARPFYMAVTEVTQAQWQAVMGTNPARRKGERLPVESVNVQDCEQFLQRLNAARLGKFRFRLPTEGEWEYAARAGATTKFHFGDDEKLLAQFEWFYGNATQIIQPVGGLKPNRAGLYDILGNIHEWCHGEVIRGGSTMAPASNCSPEYRQERAKMPNNRHSHIGLRLVCDPQ